MGDNACAVERAAIAAAERLFAEAKNSGGGSFGPLLKGAAAFALQELAKEIRKARGGNQQTAQADQRVDAENVGGGNHHG